MNRKHTNPRLTMKLLMITALAAVLFSSCLKESIADAMLRQKNDEQGIVTATLHYEVNGTAVDITAPDANNQNPNFYTLGCTKAGNYNLDAVGTSGETTFTFFTDSLTTGTYTHDITYGEAFFLSFNGQNEYVHAAQDYMTFIVTKYENGHISGTFSGQLTPLIDAGNPTNIFGAAGSVLITNGRFENVPVFY